MLVMKRDAHGEHYQLLVMENTYNVGDEESCLMEGTGPTSNEKH
jgi:hypothetical protein